MKILIKKEFEINLPNLDTNHKTASRLSDEIDSAIHRIIGSYDSIVPLDEKIEYYDHYLVIDGYKKYKPCPFCSATEDFFREEKNQTFYFHIDEGQMGMIICASCGSHGPLVGQPNHYFEQISKLAAEGNISKIDDLIKHHKDIWEELAIKAWNREE